MKILIPIIMVFFLLGCGSGGGSGSSDEPPQSTIPDDEPPQNTPSDDYTLLAWNDLGMHCTDGKDYSVFSILPPYNTLNAQLINKADSTEKLISDKVVLTYESERSLDGKINTVSATKTNFWSYVQKLFGATPEDDIGLKGYATSSLTPNQLHYNASHAWWEAEGIPITNYNDDGSKNYYPMVKVTAKDLQGYMLATTTVVLPVSDEMDCRSCHATNSSADAEPEAGWVNDADPEKDFKRNILRLHDDENDISGLLGDLRAMGYDYNASLEETAANGTPILCAVCHKSNALATSGIDTIPSLTKALHEQHQNVEDPSNGLPLSSSDNRNACYTCHPGSTTQCLRGAMGKAVDSSGDLIMQCQNCHGGMAAIGGEREGWFDEPNCQVCHQEGHRYTDVSDSPGSGTLRAVLDNRFATTPNTPASGVSLYRFSTGHGDLQCSSCHGSTHAIYPSSHAEDNQQSIAVQGHTGTIGECTACHTTVPMTTDKGPHGMHTVGQKWVDGHEDAAEKSKESCKACHGSSYTGSVLSAAMDERTFSTEWGTKKFSAGQQIGCYDCHDGPDGD